MASIIKEKNTEEYYHFWCLCNIKTGVYTYAVYGFNGKKFFEKEYEETDEHGYNRIWSKYDYIKNAPPEPIIGNNFNGSFWENYFNQLKKP